jgi:hypothetical protein
MAELTGEMLCEISGERPATRALPRGPRNDGHLWVWSRLILLAVTEQIEQGGVH